MGIKFWPHNESMTQLSQQNDILLPMAAYKMNIIELQQNYKIGQPIIINVTYIAYLNAGYHPDVKILDSNNNQIWSNCCIAESQAPGMHNGTGFYVAENWKGYPIINETGTYTIIASLVNTTIMKTFNVVS
jgi:hypothetical protein